jgi:regulator of protease activity HflC (stomatin/prohibitin superfamily)
MNEPVPDIRPRVLAWSGLGLLAWVGFAGLVARVYWLGTLFALVAQTCLFLGVLFGTVVVARRRDTSLPTEPEPPPVEPGSPRRRVPKLEASSAAVLVPTFLGVVVALGGLIYILPEVELPLDWRVGAAALSVGGAALVYLVARYANRDGAELAEGPGLLAWARSVVAMAALSTAALGLDALDLPWVLDLGVWIPALAGTSVVEALSLVQFVVVLLSAIEPLVYAGPGVWSWWTLRDGVRPTRLRAVDALGIRLWFSEPNPVRSFFSGLDRTFGIDLRSSWALAFVRKAVEPALVSVLLVGWLTTGLVMVDSDETAVKERFGAATSADVLGPGLHVVWPWPIEAVRRVSTERVRTLTVGHEEEALPAGLLDVLDPGDADDEDAEDNLLDARDATAPESRLWAKQHADQEYTLLLGDGRDLVTIDGLIHYRVADPHAWLYGMQNPEAALKSLAYRAVMERIISQTLDDALGQDFAQLAADLTVQIQQEADAHHLGVEVVDFTLGALHPPVSVAQDYQAVVSAQIAGETDRIAADAYRTGRLSEARRDVVRDAALASAVAAERRAEAVGEASAFLGLRAQVRTAEADYRFRRRMEALATNLEGKQVVVLDHRIERDGVAVWWESGSR